MKKLAMTAAIAGVLASGAAHADYTGIAGVQSALSGVYNGIQTGSWSTSTAAGALGTLSHSIDDRIRVVQGAEECYGFNLCFTPLLPAGNTNVATITTHAGALSTAVVADITAGLSDGTDSVTGLYTGNGMLIGHVNSVITAGQNIARAAGSRTVTRSQLDDLVAVQRTALNTLSGHVTSAQTGVTGAGTVVTNITAAGVANVGGLSTVADWANYEIKASGALTTNAATSGAQIWVGNHHYGSYTNWATGTLDAAGRRSVQPSWSSGSIDIDNVPAGYGLRLATNMVDVEVYQIGGDSTRTQTVVAGTITALRSGVAALFTTGGAFVQ